MHYFCTYFDCHYLTRGLALYYSLRRHCSQFRLWVLCMDQATLDVLSGLGCSDLELITLQELENIDKELLDIKKKRKVVEYYFTCTPLLPLYILNNHREVDLVTYLDADVYFFNNPDQIIKEIAAHSIAIIEHKFSACHRNLIKFGIYNVGWVSFRRDDVGLFCLLYWAKMCKQWCFDRAEGDYFADQKYLDDWPQRFKNVVVLQNKGINVAPWNIDNYTISYEKNVVLVDGVPLIFFHFHKLKHLCGSFYDTGIGYYKIKCSKSLHRSIYEPYIDMLFTIQEKLHLQLRRSFLLGNIREDNRFPIVSKAKYFLESAYNLFVFRSILRYSPSLQNIKFKSTRE